MKEKTVMKKRINLRIEDKRIYIYKKNIILYIRKEPGRRRDGATVVII